MENYFIIYSQKYAQELVRLGFIIEKIEPNRSRPAHSVYFFKDTPALQLALAKFLPKK